MTKLIPAPSWLIERPIAHRGLHDLPVGRAENSLGAFRAAVDHGYAIECDLQMSKTGVPMVFHDPSLARMTGMQGNVRDKTPVELAQLALLDTNDRIHTLRDHLDLVTAKVPLVLELKGVEGEDAGFVEGVAEAVAGYKGPLAVMSFDHWICRQFKELLPDTPRGLTAEGGADMADSHHQAMQDFDLQFVSYSVNHLPNKFVADMRAAGLPVITWTVDNDEKVAATYAHADQMTFEGFLPELHTRRMPDG